MKNFSDICRTFLSSIPHLLFLKLILKYSPLTSSLIFAAMETTSGALAHILQMLSKHQDVQNKLRQEIITAQGDKEQIEYDELVALPYLEAVCRETLRL